MPMADKFRLIGRPRSAAESGFGRGYTIGFFISFGLIIASFLAAFLARSEFARVRAVGYILVSFGAGFTFAVVYTIVTSKGIPWAASCFGRVRTGVLDRKATPIRFWGTCLITLLISSSFIGGGVWVIFHTANAVEFGRRATPKGQE
jgi:hypothetical protein